jgi:hypothetical protein
VTDVLVLVSIVTTLVMLGALRARRTARKEAVVWRHAYFAAVDALARIPTSSQASDDLGGE